MKNFYGLFLTLLFAVLLVSRVHAEDDAAARVLFDKLLSAQDTKDYDTFISYGDDQLKTGLSRTQFEASSDILKGNAAGGTREVTFLGELNQRGYEVYLYRLRFKTGDLLGTMALNSEGKVSGIWFK